MWYHRRQSEIFAHVLGPLIGLGQQESIFVVSVDGGAQLLDHRVGLTQVLIVRPFAFHQIGNRVQPEPVDSHVQPETHDLQNRFQNPGIVETQIRLMAEKAMPVVRLGEGVEGPVRRLRVGEYDARVQILLIGVAPHIKVPLRRAQGCGARGLKPGMLIRGVVDDEPATTFNPSRCASCSMARKSSRVPNCGCTF